MDVRGLGFRDVDHLTIRSFTTHGHLTGSSVSAIAEEGARLEGLHVYSRRPVVHPVVHDSHS